MGPSCRPTSYRRRRRGQVHVRRVAARSGVPGRPILIYQDWQSGMDKNNTIMNSGLHKHCPWYWRVVTQYVCQYSGTLIKILVSNPWLISTAHKTVQVMWFKDMTTSRSNLRLSSVSSPGLHSPPWDRFGFFHIVYFSPYNLVWHLLYGSGKSLKHSPTLSMCWWKNH